MDVMSMWLMSSNEFQVWNFEALKKCIVHCKQFITPLLAFIIPYPNFLVFSISHQSLTIVVLLPLTNTYCVDLRQVSDWLTKFCRDNSTWRDIRINTLLICWWCLGIIILHSKNSSSLVFNFIMDIGVAEKAFFKCAMCFFAGETLSWDVPSCC